MVTVGPESGALLDYVMTDHPAWRSVDGRRSRAFPTPDGVAALVMVRADADVAPSPDAPPLDCFSLYSLNDGHGMIDSAGLGQMGRVGRFRNPSLWDAIGTAIIRQVIRAAQARKMYQAFCERFGEAVTHDENTTHWLFPSAERVLELADDDLAELGMAFKRKGLRSAAAAYLDHRGTWELATPAELATLLQQVSYVGPWTAAASVADFSNDWTLYAYDDLAVRTWARQALPDVAWADDQLAFGQQWRQISGDQLGSATLLTLAWGEKHGDRRHGGGDPRRG